MNILGLNIGELSSAALMQDGVIVAAASEERFSRIKNDERYPLHAIDYCLESAGIAGRELDLVAIAGQALALGPWLTRSYSTFTIADHIRAQREYWYPKLYEKKDVSWLELFADRLDLKQFPGTLGELLSYRDSYSSEDVWPELKRLLYRGICDHLNIPESKIVHASHHACHAAYGYWGSPLRGEPTLVLTADAVGDDLSATISIAKNDHIERIHAVNHNEFRLARLYRYITLLLGMKPNEHEYKVMGLAPYAKKDFITGPYNVFKETMYVDGLGFGWRENPTDMYFYFKERLEGERFDAIAGGLQKYSEEIISEWVQNAIRKTDIRRLVFSGGIAMNIRVHKALHELPEVENIFVCGSSGDESTAIGACYQLMAQECRRTNRSTECIRPIDLYLGPNYSSADIHRWLEKHKLQERYPIESAVTPERVAQHLAEGAIIGRSAGRMEFGQRSLGNRSILADPRRRETVEIINRKIKNRDFWMPFAPTITAEMAGNYIQNPKKIASPFMTIAFDSTAQARRELPAALHPVDHTLRPQILTEKLNPQYHQLLSAFQKESGVGALLNTSFNLHGEPIVCSPNDALHVFENSEIDMILLEDVLIKKTDTA